MWIIGKDINDVHYKFLIYYNTTGSNGNKKQSSITYSCCVYAKYQLLHVWVRLLVLVNNSPSGYMYAALHIILLLYTLLRIPDV